MESAFSTNQPAPVDLDQYVVQLNELYRGTIEYSISREEQLMARVEELETNGRVTQLAVKKYANASVQTDDNYQKGEDERLSCAFGLAEEMRRFYIEKENFEKAAKLETKNLLELKKEVSQLIANCQKTVQQAKDSTNPFKNTMTFHRDLLNRMLEDSSQKKLDNIFESHRTKYHSWDDEERRLKQGAQKIGTELKRFVQEFKTLEERVATNYQMNLEVQNCVMKDMHAVRNVTLKTYAALQLIKRFEDENGSIVPEDKSVTNEESAPLRTCFTGRLCEVYGDDDQEHENYTIGLAAHKCVVGKGLKIEEVIHKNQFVSVIEISGTNSKGEHIIECLSAGYGDDKIAAFKNAVADLKNNRQFIKAQDRSRAASVATATHLI